MTKEIKYNVELFKIDDYNDWYKNYLYFLLRYFFNWDNFNWKISKKYYIQKWLDLWFNKDFLENIYRKWKNDNPFIQEIYKNWRDQIIKLKSIFNKNKESNLFVYLDTKLMEKITNINDFRSICYIIYACRPYRVDNKFKKKEYCYKNPSRTINNIWYNFWKITKDVMWHRLETAQKRFSDFVITKRITTYNEETTNNKYIVRIPSLYSMKWLRYKRYYNKKIEKNELINNNRNIEKKYSYVHHKNINSNKIIFWNTSKNCWFLWEDFYEHSWYKIKKQVFER